MANVTVKHVVDIVAGWLQDEETDEDDRAWTEAELVNYYNRAAAKIVSIHSRANMVIESIPLAAGSKHSIPAKGMETARIIRNTGVGGTTPGEAVTMCSLAVLEAFERNWSTVTATATILNAMLDPDNPTVFYSYPPSDGTEEVLAEFSAAPASVAWDSDGTWESEMVGVLDDYVDPLMTQMLAYAYKKDSDFPGNKEREDDFDIETLRGIGATGAK